MLFGTGRKDCGDCILFEGRVRCTMNCGPSLSRTELDGMGFKLPKEATITGFELSTRISRRNMMLAICDVLGQRGTCPRAHVGCVIARDSRILSTGYNGSLPGKDHCDNVGCEIENNHCIRTLHAEQNAIAFAARNGISVEGATLYITGYRHVCRICSKLAEAAGIKEIITRE
jgi:dCMP deaminase